MNQYKTSSELKDLAKEKIKGNYGSAISITLVTGLITTTCSMFLMMLLMVVYFALSVMFTGNTTDIPVLSTSFLVLYTVIMNIITVFINVFQVGTALFYLNIACGRRASVIDLFHGFRHQFGKALTISLVLVLISLLQTIPSTIINFIYDGILPNSWAIPVLILYVVGWIIYYPIFLSLSLSYYLMLDFPGLGAMETLKRSMAIMKGHKWRMFYLMLSFVPLLLLAALSVIGLLWVTPYIALTEALFFLDLMKPRQNPPLQQATVPETPEANTFENIPQ